jgi:hypothetical protein
MSFNVQVSIMIELAVSEALIPIYQFTWHCIPKDQNFHEHHCYMPSVMRVIASRKMRLMEHIAHMGEMRNAYSILVKKNMNRRDCLADLEEDDTLILDLAIKRDRLWLCLLDL